MFSIPTRLHLILQISFHFEILHGKRIPFLHVYKKLTILNKTQ